MCPPTRGDSPNGPLPAIGLSDDNLKAVWEDLGQGDFPLASEITCLAVGPACGDIADVPVRTGLCSWQTVFALCAGDVVFSEFLPVFEPRNGCLGGQGTCFPHRRTYS